MLKEIEGFDGYFVSDDGKIYFNLGKGNRRTGTTVDLFEVKPRLTPNGYARVYARQNSTNKRVDLYIHRVVANAFIPNPYNKKCVNHKDCNRSNNSATNLEWTTAKENTSQTIKLKHLLRGENRRYISNFDYIQPT